MELAQQRTTSAGTIDEQSLVDATRQGDDRAYEALYARYRERVQAFILSKVRDHGRAEDIAQEVFMAALRQLRATDRPIAFKPWIFAIAKNACIDEFRRNARGREVPSSSDDDELVPTRMLSLAPPPPAVMEDRQRLDDLRDAFGGLSENHHRLIVMRELEGRSYDEIGDRLGMTRQMVESSLFRARRKLSAEYDELASGRRCEQVQAVIDAGTARTLRSMGVKERRRVSRHLSHCDVCRQQARLAGVDATLLRPRSIAAKIAALLPFGGLWHWPWRGGSHGGGTVVPLHAAPGNAAAGKAAAGKAAAGGAAQAAGTAGSSVTLGQAAAAAAALAIAGAGGGLALTRDGGATAHWSAAAARTAQRAPAASVAATRAVDTGDAAAVPGSAAEARRQSLHGSSAPSGFAFSAAPDRQTGHRAVAPRNHPGSPTGGSGGPATGTGTGAPSIGSTIGGTTSTLQHTGSGVSTIVGSAGSTIGRTVGTITGTVGGVLTQPTKTLGGVLTQPTKTLGGVLTQPTRTLGGVLTQPTRTLGGVLTQPTKTVTGGPVGTVLGGVGSTLGSLPTGAGSASSPAGTNAGGASSGSTTAPAAPRASQAGPSSVATTPAP